MDQVYRGGSRLDYKTGSTVESQKIYPAREEQELSCERPTHKINSDLIRACGEVTDHKILVVIIIRVYCALFIGPYVPALVCFKRSNLDQLLAKIPTKRILYTTRQDSPPFWRDHPQLGIASAEVAILSQSNFKMKVRT
jgi:hypothetical protein